MKRRSSRRRCLGAAHLRDELASLVERPRIPGRVAKQARAQRPHRSEGGESADRVAACRAATW